MIRRAQLGKPPKPFVNRIVWVHGGLLKWLCHQHETLSTRRSQIPSRIYAVAGVDATSVTSTLYILFLRGAIALVAQLVRAVVLCCGARESHRSRVRDPPRAHSKIISGKLVSTNTYMEVKKRKASNNYTWRLLEMWW